MRTTKRAKLAEFLDPATLVDEKEFERLSAALSPISESYLRRLLRESGAPLSPMIDGVRQTNLNELEGTLVALLAEYESGSAEKKQAVRNLVIIAKNHARWTRKEENLLWLTTWLENPPLFPAWARIRRVKAEAPQPRL
jgi:hypothetical protein